MANSILESQKTNNIIGITGIIIGVIVTSVWGYIQYKQNNETKIVLVKEKNEISTNLVEKKNTFFPTSNKNNLPDTNKSDKDRDIKPEKERENTIPPNFPISENTKTNNTQPILKPGIYQLTIQNDQKSDNYFIKINTIRGNILYGKCYKKNINKIEVISSIEGEINEDTFKFDELQEEEKNIQERYYLKKLFGFKVLPSSKIATGYWEGIGIDNDQGGKATFNLNPLDESLLH